MILQVVAIVVASVAGMAVGAVWFAGPIMGRRWDRAAGRDAAPTVPSWTYLLAFVATGVTAGVLSAAAHVAHLAWGGSYLWIPLIVALIGWLGFTVARSAVEYLFEQRPFALFTIDMGHQLLVVVVMAIILGAFGA